MARGEHWTWSIRLKSDPDQLIGSISLMKGEHENRGFWLGLPWHGRGLMTEASDAVTDFWFNTLKYPVLRVPKAIANTASRRISEKQGMRVVATRRARLRVAGGCRRRSGRSRRRNGTRGDPDNARTLEQRVTAGTKRSRTEISLVRRFVVDVASLRDR